MKNEALNTDLLFYDITIRALAIVATVLFSLLFFQGAEAAKKTDAMNQSFHKAPTTITAYNQ